MPPTQPIRNGQSAISTEISIPGFTLATYSRSTDPAFAPRSIKHQPRISSSGYKRKVNTTSLDDAKRPKPEEMSTRSRDVPARDSRSPSLSVPAPIAVDPGIVPRPTDNPLNYAHDRINTHTPTSQTPIQIPLSPSLSAGSKSATPSVAITAPAFAIIANPTTPDSCNQPVGQMEPSPIMNGRESDNPAEAALLAIFGWKRPCTSALASPIPANLCTATTSAATTSRTPSTELAAVAQHDPGPDLDVPPIPLGAIATLQSVSADLFMVLGRGDISNNENQLFAAAGKMSACLQAHFVTHMDAWRTDAMRPKAAIITVPKRDEMVSTAIQTGNIAGTEADDMLSKAIQTILTVEPEPEPEPSAPRRI